jgi:hypothetical protein
MTYFSDSLVEGRLKMKYLIAKSIGFLYRVGKPYF